MDGGAKYQEYLLRKKQLEDELANLEENKPNKPKSDFCSLGRFENECSIFLYTSSKSCLGCGHYKNN